MIKLIIILYTLSLSNLCLATGGEVPGPQEKCSNVAGEVATSLVKEVDITSYEYVSIGKPITLNNGSVVTVNYDKYTYSIGKENVASYLNIILDSSCKFIKAEVLDNY